jgi:hypothetical protein
VLSFRYRLHEGKTSTRCELATFIANTALITEMEFMNEHVLGQVIMASKDLTEALQSIDNSTKEVTFSFLHSTRQAIKQRQRHSIAPSQDPGGRQMRGASSIILSTAEEDEEDDERYSHQDRNGVDGNDTIQMMRIRAEGVSGSTEVSSNVCSKSLLRHLLI